MSTILTRILDDKLEQVAHQRRRLSLASLRSQCADLEPTRGFTAKLDRHVGARGHAVIAEIKKASPSKGVIRAQLDAAQIARSYQRGGASCLSVLTDVKWFQGSDENLIQARQACELPVLRKDFIVDAWQLYHSRAIGADCVLLIVSALSDSQIREYTEQATELGLDVLIETHDGPELDVALSTSNRLIGINNRNLATFETTLATTLDLIDRIPGDRLLVTESGLHAREDIQRMLSHQVRAFLIGEAFMRQPDPGEGLATLFELEGMPSDGA